MCGSATHDLRAPAPLAVAARLVPGWIGLLEWGSLRTEEQAVRLRGAVRREGFTLTAWPSEHERRDRTWQGSAETSWGGRSRT